MKAHIEHDWARDALKIWLYQPGPNMTVQVVGLNADGELLMQDVEPGVQMAPSMVLPTAALEALVKEASGVLPPSETTVDAMHDARTTRDRLLALVERMTPTPTGGKS